MNFVPVCKSSQILKFSDELERQGDLRQLKKIRSNFSSLDNLKQVFYFSLHDIMSKKLKKIVFCVLRTMSYYPCFPSFLFQFLQALDWFTLCKACR